MPNADEIKGRVKRAIGDLTNNQDLQNEGRADQAAGRTKERVDEVLGKVGGKVSDTVDRARDRARGRTPKS